MSDGHPLMSAPDKNSYHDSLNKLAPTLKRCSDGIKSIHANSVKCVSNSHTALEASLGRKIPRKKTRNAKLQELISTMQQYARRAASARARHMTDAETIRHHKSLQALAVMAKENADSGEKLAVNLREVHRYLQNMHDIFDRYARS